MLEVDGDIRSSADRSPSTLGMEHPARIFFGDAKHPVVSGEAWLIANRWSRYQAVLVGTIRGGQVRATQEHRIPAILGAGLRLQALAGGFRRSG